MHPFIIANRQIGPGHPAYIIAEMSANHGNSFEHAVEVLKAAKDAGADAVKLQTYRPETMTLRCDNPHFQVGAGTIWEGVSLWDLYEEAHTPWEWQPELKRIAEELGLHCFSTPFDHTAVDFLEDMNVPAHKVASFEMVDIPLLERIAATGKPVIMSTGMATESEIDDAVETLKKHGCTQFALLKCTSAYPAPPESLNLRTIPHLAEKYGVPAGLSDHTLGIAAPVAATALGACIIEKHFTTSRDIPGPDSSFSLEPHEFKAMVESVRVAEAALGEVKFATGDSEQPSRVFRRSLFAVQDIQPGQPFTSENVRSIRPGYGLPPKHLPEVLNQTATEAIPRGTPLQWRHVA